MRCNCGEVTHFHRVVRHQDQTEGITLEEVNQDGTQTHNLTDRGFEA